MVRKHAEGGTGGPYTWMHSILRVLRVLGLSYLLSALDSARRALRCCKILRMALISYLEVALREVMAGVLAKRSGLRADDRGEVRRRTAAADMVNERGQRNRIDDRAREVDKISLPPKLTSYVDER